MTSAEQDRVDDRKGALDEDDHMRDMERLELTVLSLDRPFASVMRVTGQIDTNMQGPWSAPNVAVRMELEQPADGRATTRVYTVRHFDAAEGLVEIDFVLHEGDGPAMRWLRAAVPGTKVWMTGPRQHFVPPQTPGRRAAMLADDTAVPAIHAILAAWPDGQAGTVWIDSVEPDLLASLPAPKDVTRHLLLRGPQDPPGTSQALRAVADTLTDPAAWTVWAAGERQEMRDLRSALTGRGFARSDLQILGYWRHGVSSSEVDRQRLAEYERIRAMKRAYQVRL